MKKIGQIVTFYSFKGGVGRTMALANVAFLAALSGKKVLIMDWDLEAPGLHHYFRGLVDVSEFKAVKEKAGVLDMLWRWKSEVAKLHSKKDISNLEAYLTDKSSFESHVSNLSKNIKLPHEGRLDLIGAGSLTIATRDGELAYEAALSAFDWNSFISDEFGSIFIEQLKSWAIHEYDFVLVDSRTGLADIAGICTMYLPDLVAMFFVLNRQNIEGTAKVAAAIRKHRRDLIPIRAIPTRVLKLGTSEESDAKALVVDQLIKVGGFSLEAANADINKLALPQTDGVPFIETLAMFASGVTDPKLDVLTLTYVGLTNQLLGLSLPVPNVEQELMATVRRRLRPQKATPEYIEALKEAEPTRAMNEIIGFIDSAIEAEIDETPIDDSHIRALVHACELISSRFDDVESEYLLTEKALELLRVKYGRSHDVWRNDLVNELKRGLDLVQTYFGQDEGLSILEELDDVLSGVELSSNLKIERIGYRLKSARMLEEAERLDAAKRTIGQVRALIASLIDIDSLAMDQKSSLILSDAEAFLILGDVYLKERMPQKAIVEFEAGLYRVKLAEPHPNKHDAHRLKFDFNFNLATCSEGLVPTEVRVMYAVDAAEAGRGFQFASFRFQTLIDIVLLTEKTNPTPIFRFCTAVFFDQGRGQRSALVSTVSRSINSSKSFLDRIELLVLFLEKNANIGLGEIPVNLLQTLDLFKRTVERRHSATAKANSYKLLMKQLEKVKSLLDS